MSFDIAFLDAYLSLRDNSFFLFCNKFFTFFFILKQNHKKIHIILTTKCKLNFFFKKKDIIP